MFTTAFNPERRALLALADLLFLFASPALLAQGGIIQLGWVVLCLALLYLTLQAVIPGRAAPMVPEAPQEGAKAQRMRARWSRFSYSMGI